MHQHFDYSYVRRPLMLCQSFDSYIPPPVSSPLKLTVPKLGFSVFCCESSTPPELFSSALADCAEKNKRRGEGEPCSSGTLPSHLRIPMASR